VEPKGELASAFTAEEVHSIVTESRREGLLDEEEHGLLTGALELAARPAVEVMVPIERLVTAPSGASPREVERIVARTGFSRLPVQAGTDGEIVGYLHVKDLLYADDNAYAEPVPVRRVRALVTVPADEDVEEALAAMQRAGSHLARVVEPDGRTAGVLFLEDVLEELVGEVRDATQRPARAHRPPAKRSLDGALTPPQRPV
jgi:CBS domain containing-hemolysin-like protein